ncbi:DUF1934 domain-containing protein [Paenibacillus sp. 481]|uniref:DUF1934 domain-containing protein n=1 Tax=Paenibacillus sp. 481 TaxID=2835869 RepID=UPI001E5E1827|nr:DUF1934 domain-containing protein [Paenibacillus sp. 481]UHA75245.1 DUF1934 domain-containing protein [Paenibacillus sp. 481]
MTGQSPDKLQVYITVRSRQDEEQVVQRIVGDLYRKGDSFFLRYVEPAPEQEGVKRRRGSKSETASQQTSDDSTTGTTQVTMKISKDQMKLIRRGHVESEQTFDMKQRQTGFYRSPVMRFLMTTETTKLDLGAAWPFEGPLQFEQLELEWAYRLYIEDQCTGQFDLLLRLRPHTQQSE